MTSATEPPPDLYCPDCGYNLHGLTSGRCPECGLLLDFIESDTPIIPWERRRELGRFQAYWQTVSMVMFRNKVFCRAAYRDVNYGDAQSFRALTILHACAFLILILPTLELAYGGLLEHLVANTGVWFVALVLACAILALVALTGLPSYLFHPRFLTTAQQNRAIALSYYGSAALALTPLATLVGLGAAAFAHDPQSDWNWDLMLALLKITLAATAVILCIGLVRAGKQLLRWPAIAVVLAPLSLIALVAILVVIDSQADVGIAMGLLAVLLPAGLLLLYWLDLLAIARRTMRRSWTTLRVALLVPLLWFFASGAILVVLPVIAYLIAIFAFDMWGGELGK